MPMLVGKRILVTRPAHQAENLVRLIQARGGLAVLFPTLAIVPVDDVAHIRNVLAAADHCQWLVFISANAVNFAVQANGGKIGRFKSTRVAAVGQTTADALRQAGIDVDLLPERTFNSEALLATPEFQDVAGQAFLIVRGEGGREELAEVLRGRGAAVTYLNVYKRVRPFADVGEVNECLATGGLDAVTITSGEALKNLLAMLEQRLHPALMALPLIVIGDRIKTMAEELGFKRIAVADNASDAAMLEAVVNSLTGGIRGGIE